MNNATKLDASIHGCICVPHSKSNWMTFHPYWSFDHESEGWSCTLDCFDQQTFTFFLSEVFIWHCSVSSVCSVRYSYRTVMSDIQAELSLCKVSCDRTEFGAVCQRQAAACGAACRFVSDVWHLSLVSLSVSPQPKGFRRYYSSPLLIQEQYGCIKEVMPIGEQLKPPW